MHPAAKMAVPLDRADVPPVRPESCLGRDRSAAPVPGGHCAQVMDGDRSCRKASDCRLGRAFRIWPDRREVFERERTRLEELARQAKAKDLERDAQNLRQIAALNQAVLDRIDEEMENAG